MDTTPRPPALSVTFPRRPRPPLADTLRDALRTSPQLTRRLEDSRVDYDARRNTYSVAYTATAEALHGGDLYLIPNDNAPRGDVYRLPGGIVTGHTLDLNAVTHAGNPHDELDALLEWIADTVTYGWNGHTLRPTESRSSGPAGPHEEWQACACGAVFWTYSSTASAPPDDARAAWARHLAAVQGKAWAAEVAR